MHLYCKYIATALPDLREQNSLGTISAEQEAWIGPLALVSFRLYNYCKILEGQKWIFNW